MDFQLGQPFRPYQQLMGVLPDRSKKIVPSTYHELMTNPDSPIIDFYPRDFKLDMNGKKMEWEAVVKIPFIDEKRLLAAMRPKDQLLTDDERARNEFGVSLKFTYSPEIDFTYPSSLVGIFPDISHCRCVANVFELPTLEGLGIYVGLMEGVKLGTASLAGFPSLKTLPHSGALGFHGVNVFQQESRNESMVVTIQEAEVRTKVESAKTKLGKKVHVGYPFLQEAKVVRVSDELFDYVLPEREGAPVIPVPHGPFEIDQWQKKAGRIESNYSKRLGMLIGDVESLVHVDMLKGLKKMDDGAISKEYAQIPGIETDYATQVVVDEVISEDQRFLERLAVPIEEEYPEGSRAFFLGEFNYGRPLEVLRAVDNKADVWISRTKGREPEFGREYALNSERMNRYIPSYAVARMLSLNPLVLSKITSSFSVMLDDQRLNLGLNLKFEAKKLKVLGYSRRATSGWEFSQKAIELIQQYMITFPEFIAGIQRKPQGDLYLAEDFYPEEMAREKMKEIQAWLKSVESKSFERVPLDAEQLDSDVVMQIEKAADESIQNSLGVEGKKIKGVPRNALLKPADAEHRLGNQRFAVGDRVVYVQDSGKVPIASRGTVVGLTRTPRTVLLDIVFDMTFMSGTSLGDRCSPFRGSTVSVSSVLNLTDRQLIALTKAGADHRAVPTPVSNTARFGVPMGPGGQGQYVDAQPPGPLKSSWREAAMSDSRPGGNTGGSGQGGAPSDIPRTFSQGNRSRGSPHIVNGNGRGVHPRRGRGDYSAKLNGVGYVPIDQGTSSSQEEADGGFMQNNPNFRPQVYSNVPPPASLDVHRGRGGFSSRGRGRGGADSHGGSGPHQRRRGGRGRSEDRDRRGSGRRGEGGATIVDSTTGQEW